MVEEPTMCAYAVTEPGAGSDMQGMKTTAVKRRQIHHQRLQNVDHQRRCRRLVFCGRPDRPERKARGGMTAFIVEKNWDGVVVGKKEMNLVNAVQTPEGSPLKMWKSPKRT